MAKQENKYRLIFEEITSSKKPPWLETVTSEDAFVVYQSKQQQARDKTVTKILSDYEELCHNKADFTKQSRKIILWTCVALLVLLVLACVVLSIFSFIWQPDSLEKVISLIAGYTAIIVLVVEMIKTIMQYIFPTNDDAGITQIVQSIQNNDLADKKENLAYKRWIAEHPQLDSNEHSSDNPS